MNNRKFRSLWIVITLLMAGLAISLHPASAQSDHPGLNMQAQVGFDGNFKYGEWLPIWVTLENNGADLETIVKATINQSTGNVTFAKEVSLATGSRKQVVLYVLPNNFSREIEIQLVDENELLTTQTVTVSPNQNDAYFVGIISPDWGPLSQIASIDFDDSGRKIVLSSLDVDQFPELAMGLNSFDAIVINDIDTANLTEGQQIALESWVQDGGFLVIGGGAGIEKTIAGLPESLIQFELQGYTEETSLPNLERLANNQEILLDGPFVVSEVQTRGENTTAASEGISMLHQWKIGEGTVSLVPLSLTDSPFNAWSGTPAFWKGLLQDDAYFPIWMPRDVSLRQMRSNGMTYPLSNLPALDLPSIKSLGILLVVYIIAIGPANYFILKSRQKLHLAWVTIPVLTIAFTAGAFGLAYALRGNDIVTNKLSIISLNPDGHAKVTSYIGVFSPAQESYEIEVSGDILLSPSTSGYYDAWSSVAPTIAGETIFMQDNPAKVVGLQIDQWSMQSFNSENASVYFGQIESNLTLSGNTISGEVTNKLDIPIQDAVVVVGNRVMVIGDFGPNETKSVEVVLADQPQDFMTSTLTYLIMDSIYPSGAFNQQREYELKRSILDSTFQPYGYWIGPDFETGETTSDDKSYFPGIFLLGWVEQSPPEIVVNGREASQNTLGLLTTHLPLQVASGAYTIPVSLIEGRLTKQPLNGGYCGSTSTHIYLDYGSSEFEFQLPANLIGTEMDTLLLGFQEDISQWSNVDPGFKVSIYNWDKARWSVISEITNGVNTIEDIAPYISQSGAVRIQVDKETQNVGGCVLVSVGLEGSKP